MKNMQIVSRNNMPVLENENEMWHFNVSVHKDFACGFICFGGADDAAPIIISLRPDGGLKQTHGRCKRFEPDKDKNHSSIGTINGTHYLSSVTVRYNAGTHFEMLLSPNIHNKTYSLYIYSGKGRLLKVAENYYMNTKCGSFDFAEIVVLEEKKGSVTVSDIGVASLPQKEPNGDPIVYRVGSKQTIKNLQNAVNIASAGDMILVDSDYLHKGILTLPFSGTPDSPIIIKGIKNGEKRPVIDGTFDIYSVEASGHNIIFESFEVKNAAKTGICHHADNLVIRDCVIHNCLMGILSDQDIGMGSCEIAFCEVYDCGFESYSHQLYMATDNARYPGSVIKIHNCYIHDALGGNNIKTRALRNEIYNNKITNAFYHNLELVGPDLEFNPDDASQQPHNTDVWDNYFENKTWYQFRCGGDGTGDTNGTFRFVGNTVVNNFNQNEEEFTTFRIMFGIKRIEAYNNRFIHRKNSAAYAKLWKDVNAIWIKGEEYGNSLVDVENTYYENCFEIK